jgi:hypothetical protein
MNYVFWQLESESATQLETKQKAPPLVGALFIRLDFE